MSDTTPDTTALRARCEVAAGRTVALNVAHRILLDPSIVRALCDGYDEAQRLRGEVERVTFLRAWVIVAERDAARQALAEERNAFNFFRTTHTCFTDAELLAYRIRQREHGARKERERPRFSDPDREAIYRAAIEGREHP